jgi:hypothetical protein
MNAAQIASNLVSGQTHTAALVDFRPVAPSANGKPNGDGPAPGDIPTKLDQLPEAISRSYDLSVTAAAQASIPILGSVSGGYNRRVIVLERTAYKSVRASAATYQYGYAIRLCVTVSTVSGTSKLTLPFLAASAEIGTIEASWMMQVVGLSGPAIDKVAVIPTELNVETFVLAKQSLASLISAVDDPSVVFSACQLAVVTEASVMAREYAVSVETAYALAQLARRKRLSEAMAALHTATDEMRATITDVYREFAGIADDTQPSAQVQSQASQLLDGVNVDAR